MADMGQTSLALVSMGLLVYFAIYAYFRYRRTPVEPQADEYV